MKEKVMSKWIVERQRAAYEIATAALPTEECPECGGEGMVIISEYCDWYDRVHLQWDACGWCGGTGWVESELEDRE